MKLFSSLLLKEAIFEHEKLMPEENNAVEKNNKTLTLKSYMIGTTSKKSSGEVKQKKDKSL